MKQSEKRVFQRTAALGLALTLATIAADAAGSLGPLERYFYDQRARLCQYFRPAPTDQIVHIDIDDPSLKEIGAFPWPRTRLAEMIDEIRLAGAKVIGMDIIFPEPQETRYEKQLDGKIVEVHDDARFAAAISRAGNVLVPISVQLRKVDDPSPPVPPVPGVPRLLEAPSELATTPEIAQAAALTGVVDFLPDPDGVARSMPLFVNHRGKLMPHMALTAACAQLGVPVEQVTITEDAVTIPLPDAPPIIIPVRTIQSEAFGPVGTFMPIPWIGKGGRGSWLTALDAPRYAEPKQHISLRAVWQICQNLHQIESNTHQAYRALAAANRVYPSPPRTAYLTSPTAEARQPVLEMTLKELAEMADIPALERATQLSEDDRAYLTAYRDVRDVIQANSALMNLLTQQRADLRRQLEGKYALIGWTATGKTDFYPTSIEPLCPGVAMHGMVLNAILTRDFWRFAPWWMGALITLLIGTVTTLLVARLSIWWSLPVSMALVGGWALLNGIVLFDYNGIILGAAGPIVAPMLTIFGVTAGRFIYERAERSRITQRFGRYVDPVLVDYVVENPHARFDGQVREMTVVFTDLAGFTAISEKLREATVPLLNDYMGIMLPIIRYNRGYWNKFLGDGIMFFYNALADNPAHATDAVRTVLQMQEALVPFNKELERRGLPAVAMRAGITTGLMVVGDAGSTDPNYYASDYTVLGDEVNLAARLESANKAVGSQTLINARAAEQVRDSVLVRPIGLVRVVGKTEPVMTYEPICMKSAATAQQIALVQASEAMIEHYLKGRFQSCIAAAEALESTFGASKYTGLYRGLCLTSLSAGTSEAFDGIVTLQEK